MALPSPRLPAVVSADCPIRTAACSSLIAITLAAHLHHLAIMKIDSFHALVRGVALADYWHDNSECFIVQSIALADRLPGRADWERCPYCQLLDFPPVLSPRPPSVL